MKKLNPLTILTVIITLLSAQNVMADKANANVVTSDANNHYLTIDYSKYNFFITEKIRGEDDWISASKNIENAYNLDNGNLDITFNYPCNQVDFQISTTWFATWGNADIAIDETYNDNETWDDSKTIFTKSKISGHNQKISATTISYTDKIAKKIAFKKNGGSSDGKYVHDIKLYIAPHIIFSSPTTFDFETTKIGECTSYQTIEFYSFLSEGELVIEKPTNFIISSINGQTPTLSGEAYRIASNNTLRYIGETNEQKKYTIVIGFQPTKTGKITETIKIKDSQNQKTITLNGEGFDKQPQTITWNQSLYSLQAGNTITLDATASSGLPITYTSSNSSIVSINGNQLTAIANGTATITATVAGNDLYAPTTLEKYAKVGNGNISNCSGNIILKTNNGGTGKSFSYTFTNLPPIKNKKIKFNYTIAKKAGVFSSNTSYSVSISNNRDNQTQGFSQSNSDRSNPSTGNKEYTFEKDDITELTITMESNQNGSAISGLSVELPTTLYTNITDAITFPQTPIDESASKPLKISFAQLKDNIDISITGTDASHFSINKSYIETGCGNWGIETINIYFSPNSYKEGNYNATLVIKSEGQTDIKILLEGSTLYRETTFNNNGNWNDNANWSAGIPTGIGKNATIAAAVTISNGYTAVANNITIADGGSIIIEPQGALKVGSSINNTSAENLILQANENGSAILLFNNPADNKVNATVELHSIAASEGLRNGQPGNFKDPKWQYLGITAENVEFSILNPNGTTNWIYRWDETQNATSCWAEELTNGSTLSAWKGYCLAQESATTYSYSASLINGDHTYSLTYTPENAGADLGNNLLTNSYTAPIDITTLRDTNFINAEANIYIYNTGSYFDWKNQTELEGFAPGQVIVIPVNTVSALGNEYPRTIASAQAFFVKANTKNASFTIDYKKNVFGSTRKENVMRAKSSNQSDKSDPYFNTLKIQITSSTSNDRLYLLENENTTDNFDNGYDAIKIFDNPNGPQIYATTPFGSASINTSYSFDGQSIGFVANNENEIYTISFDITNLDFYNELYLYDTETELYIDILNEEIYQFYGSKTPNHTRFVITSTRHDAPQNGGVTTDVENLTTWNNFISEDKPIYIYTLIGQLIGIYEQHSIIDIPNGIYIVKCGDKCRKLKIENSCSIQ